ncbi:MAG: GAF domain-containing protein [Nocardioides sp.]
MSRREEDGVGVDPSDQPHGEQEPGLAAVELDTLLREVLTRVQGALDEQDRLRLLLDAVVTMAADLSLDGVLARIVTIASRLVDAQYAALGVIGTGPERPLRTFVHHGFSEAQVAEIGELPRGHGLLGLIIDHPEPLRLRHIAAHPASYGFPPHHPPMTSFLGVPVRIRDQVFGNLYLTEKVGGGDFTQDDEDVVVALAAAAGVAIENARLYEQAAQRERWLAASAEITRVLTGPEGHGDLDLVAELARSVALADVAWVVAGESSQGLSLVAQVGAAELGEEVRAVVGHDEVSAEVMETGRAARFEGVGERVVPAVVAPLGASAGITGVLVLAWAPERAAHALAVEPAQVGRYVEQAALALQVARARDSQQRLAVFEDRDRIGRDLHDLVIQRLFAVGLGLQGLARQAETPDTVNRLEQAVDDLDATIKDIRRSIFALGALDASTDVQTEVTRLVDRAAGTLGFRPTLLLEGPVRTLVDGDLAPDLLAVLGEALSNASRHADARRVEVLLEAGDQIVLTISDDGRGVPDDAVESGLRNMRERAAQRGGTFSIVTAPGTGTRLTWSVPRRT